jgi:hypothetical protein
MWYGVEHTLPTGGSAWRSMCRRAPRYSQVPEVHEVCLFLKLHRVDLLRTRTKGQGNQGGGLAAHLQNKQAI